MFNRKRQASSLIKAIATVAAAGFLLTACSSTAPTTSTAPASEEPAAEVAEEVKIFMAPKFTGLAYFEVARVGGEEAAADLGFEFEYIGSDKPDATEQIATLTNAIPQSPAALVVSAIDGDAIAPALKQAREAGIKVVTYDADAAVDSRDLFINQLS